MRVEAAPYVFRSEDRRRRFEDRRTADDDRRIETAHTAERARHEAHVWFAPAFGAHILGQAKPQRVTPAEARRAYAQPEARTPLRPRVVKRA
jgi:hypothetical protein